MATGGEGRGNMNSNMVDNNKEELARQSNVKDSSGEAKTDKSQKTDNGTGKAAQSKNNGSASRPSADIEFILDIPLEITAELGRTEIQISELLKLGQGSVIEFTKLAGETLDVLANQKLIARGEVVVVNEKYGIRLTEIAPPTERIERLR